MVPRFPVIAVEIGADDVDEVCALLFEAGASGIEVRDDDTHPEGIPRLVLSSEAGRGEPSGTAGAAGAAAGTRAADGVLQVSFSEVETSAGQLRSLESRVRAAAAAVAEDPSGGNARSVVLASFEHRREAEQASRAVAAAMPVARCRLVVLQGDEWRDRFRDAFQPFRLTDSLTVTPPWIEPPGDRSARERSLVIDPGRAFGTGLHATTALVAQLLEEHAARLAHCELLDVGTGSGILSLCALRLGAARATAVDTDPEAVAAARANAEHNGLSERLAVSTTPLGRVEGRFPWVVANIEQRVLEQLAGDLGARVTPRGRLVLSGVLEPQVDSLLHVFGARGAARSAPFVLRETRRRTVDRDTWVALLLERREAP
ncbi:MAG: 50S ribosomal protein L11 methyltransferase [Deltaproteobacteria bacterium]|jgi:ribosomal protein L11 methyltransferase|nr:50S ribosomal protein L11 methyltransferase [Deltaproteobacteria bacterium]MBW2532157.1 50S ribosomal protein L11 methyltransferase [Deltaproteobacteria bacterium]